MFGFQRILTGQHLFLWHLLGFNTKNIYSNSNYYSLFGEFCRHTDDSENILQENGVKYRLNWKRMWLLSQTDTEYPYAKLFCRIYIFFPVLYLGLGGKYEILQIDKSQRT